MTAVHHFYDDLMRISSEMINYRGTVSSLGSVCLAACCYREARVHDRRRTTGSRCSGGTAAVDSCPARRTEARRCRLPGCGSARPVLWLPRPLSRRPSARPELTQTHTCFQCGLPSPPPSSSSSSLPLHSPGVARHAIICPGGPRPSDVNPSPCSCPQGLLKDQI